MKALTISIKYAILSLRWGINVYYRTSSVDAPVFITYTGEYVTMMSNYS
jgi:hypothetical protein